MKTHHVVNHTDWIQQRRALLAKEKDFQRARDELAGARRALPWERVDKRYLFEGADGPRTLTDLFGARSQLAIYHFMFAPEWQAGCKSCTFWADSLDHVTAHLAARDVAFCAVSRAPYAKLAAYRERMGWELPWVSSAGSDFNYDYGVSFDTSKPEHVYNYERTAIDGSEREGLSVFARDGEEVFHTYSTYARGIDMLNVTYQILDLVPKGRDEDAFAFPMQWLRRRDEYDARAQGGLS
jgi:predicted dithiol-disulfide oxidoreductase (DUF899 family)